MNAAIMPVAVEMLRALLHLPEDAVLTNAYVKPEQPNVVHFVVHHEDLPPTGDDDRLPIVTPMFITHYYESDGPRVEFKSW